MDSLILQKRMVDNNLKEVLSWQFYNVSAFWLGELIQAVMGTNFVIVAVSLSYAVVGANHFSTIFGVSRSTLNTTYNVLDLLMGIMLEVPPHVLRRHVPRNSLQQLFTLINEETKKEVSNTLNLSKLLFRDGTPFIATSAQQDISQVGTLIHKIEKWALSIFTPEVKEIKLSWMLYDRDPRWYPDCIGKYRCKRVTDYDIYMGSRSLSWANPLIGWSPRLLHTNTDSSYGKEETKHKECVPSAKSNISGENATTPNSRGKSVKNAFRDGTIRVRPRDIKVVYLN